MQNRKSSSQPVFFAAIAVTLVMTVMVTFGTLVDAVAGIQTFL